MSYDGHESRDIKAENPLTPKPDNSWIQAIPIRRQPWDKPKPDTEKSPSESVPTEKES